MAVKKKSYIHTVETIVSVISVLLFVGAVWGENEMPGCVARAETKLGFYNFTEYSDQLLFGAIEYGEEQRTVRLSFCSTTDILLLDAAYNYGQPEENWLGFNSGVWEGIAGGQDGEADFIATTARGDAGKPCEAEGRSSEIQIYCADGEKVTCPSGKCATPGDPVPEAMASFCICSARYAEDRPCRVLVELSMACPPVSTLPSPPTPIPVPQPLPAPSPPPAPQPTPVSPLPPPSSPIPVPAPALSPVPSPLFECPVCEECLEGNTIAAIILGVLLAISVVIILGLVAYNVYRKQNEADGLTNGQFLYDVVNDENDSDTAAGHLESL